jgi:hypothetical protein
VWGRVWGPAVYSGTTICQHSYVQYVCVLSKIYCLVSVGLVFSVIIVGLTYIENVHHLFFYVLEISYT